MSASILPTCSLHPDVKAMDYCLTDGVYRCSDCVLDMHCDSATGSHNIMSSLKLPEILRAYAEKLEYRARFAEFRAQRAANLVECLASLADDVAAATNTAVAKLRAQHQQTVEKLMMLKRDGIKRLLVARDSVAVSAGHITASVEYALASDDVIESAMLLSRLQFQRSAAATSRIALANAAAVHSAACRLFNSHVRDDASALFSMLCIVAHRFVNSWNSGSTCAVWCRVSHQSRLRASSSPGTWFPKRKLTSTTMASLYPMTTDTQ